MCKYYCYILTCSDDTLYTGYTNNLEKRLKQHNSKKGAKYTRRRIPCILSYYEEFENKTDALKREYYIKHKLSRKDKLCLIEEFKKRGGRIE